jgi:tRNA threonylcarbamoyladenosine biosynthesis protein TsaE
MNYLFKICLVGNSGTGKTTFIRGILASLGFTGGVKSPTYTIVETYTQVTPKIYHFDLYRILYPEELESLGIRDYLANAGICCFEWPENGGRLLPPPNYIVTLTISANTYRNVTIEQYN